LEGGRNLRLIEIQSFSWGVSNTSSGAAGGGGGAGKASFTDLSFQSALSKAAPNLMLACATGRHFPLATLTCRKAGGKGIEFLKIKLSDILVSSYQSGGSTGADLPEDSFSLNFTKIDFLYTVERTGETIETAFDLRENKA
jgi:type VI secretion system secreted protein Hcp